MVLPLKLNAAGAALALDPNANGVGVVDGAGADWPKANEDEEVGAGNPGIALLPIELLNAGAAAGAPNPVATGAPKPDDGGGNEAAGVDWVFRNANPGVAAAGAGVGAGNEDGKEDVGNEEDAGNAGALLAMAENDEADVSAGAGVFIMADGVDAENENGAADQSRVAAR